MMRNHLLALLVGVALLGANIETQAGLKILEHAVETSTLVVSLPDSSTGSMAVKSCPSCKPMLLRLTPSSKFLVGRTPVPYAEFVALTRGASDRGLGIFYDRESRTITRLIIAGTRLASPQQR